MVKFTYRPYVAKTGDKFIKWVAEWDGVYDDSNWQPHPFQHTKDFYDRWWYWNNYRDECEEEDNPEILRQVGDVVADNFVTRAICEMLSLPLDELQHHCGSTTPECYRDSLIAALDDLWD